MKRKILTTLILMFIHINVHAMSGRVNYRVIPLPASIELKNGKPFVLNDETVISAMPGLANEGELLSEYLHETTGFKPAVVPHLSGKRQKQILLELDDSVDHAEGYWLKVSQEGIFIKGKSPAGVFYGIQTLRKSLPIQTGTSFIELPAVVINDAPRFGYRGMMLDCARHFFPISVVKEYIDLIALHNMNNFHWHLTDDQGWRIEIKAFPELTSIGSMRSGTVIANSTVDDEIVHGGYYTQEEIREVIRYANDRHITVIPEIDMPGHMLAALATFPELGCKGGPYKVGHQWGIYNDVLCMGNPKTMNFVKTVLDEVMQLFPSRYIHVGGDETPTVRWEHCPKCQSIRLNSGETLQGHFTKEIERFVQTKGKQIIGWDEILGMGIDSSTTIMAWRGMQAGVKAAEQGHDVLLTPLTHCYFDYYQTSPNVYEPTITGMWPIEVKKVYELDPLPDSLSVQAKEHILGVQANLWSEHIAVKNVIEYMVLPRMAALAEVQWTPKQKKDFDDFYARLTILTCLYEHYNWEYAKHLWPERLPIDRWHH